MIMTSYLPPYDGLLPYWLLLVSLTALNNTVQCYRTLYFTRRVYEGPAGAQVTPLSSRTFGTWSLLSTLIRLGAAYNIHSWDLYTLTLCTYVIALGHFGSEWLVFRTAKFGAGLLGPLVVATVSMVWMLTQWNFYVG